MKHLHSSICSIIHFTIHLKWIVDTKQMSNPLENVKCYMETSEYDGLANVTSYYLLLAVRVTDLTVSTFSSFPQVQDDTMTWFFF